MLALLPLISGVVLVAPFLRLCWGGWYLAENPCSRSFQTQPATGHKTDVLGTDWRGLLKAILKTILVGSVTGFFLCITGRR